MDGYRPLATAPTGIATVSLEAEGFEEVATCDRLLADLDRGRERLDSRTVLVVDEAGMLGSRKLTRLLGHAEQAQAKVVLVGDDRQLAAIDAGGGFRGLRLRLGASELVENRRQQQAWEREALELVRSGLVEEAVAAYRAHDRVVAAESKPAATLALLQDWWQAYQEAERDPAQDVIVLAGRRAEVDRLNVACQQLLAAQGRLGPERFQVEDRQLAVGDRVVCGRNALDQLGVANGTRGIVTALDPDTRTLTIRLEGKEPPEVILPGWYLDGRSRGERNRRVDLAYATTGHRAQGLTRWRALVRLSGAEDANWLYVQLSRARHETTLYPVVGPEPQGPVELDLPDQEVGDGYDQLAQALSRAGEQRLAIDTPSSLDLRRLSTRELRAERDRLRQLLDQAPRDRTRELQRATARRAEADQALAQVTTSSDPQRQGRGCFANAGEASRPRPTGPPLWWPASRPTAPTTPSWPCVGISRRQPALGGRRQRAGRARSGPPVSTTRRPPWPGNLTLTQTASGPPVMTSSRGCRSAPSARPTWPPCSPTSTTTRTRTTSSGPVGRRLSWRCGSGPASAAPAPPPTANIDADGPRSWPSGSAACPGG
jgi:hypothetical protein